IEAIPTCAQSWCLPRTYAWLPGSSPTSTVPRPGTMPRSASADTRSLSSALMVAASALPSRIRAVMSTPSNRSESVKEMSRASEIHRRSSSLYGRNDVLIAHRATRLDNRRHSGAEQNLRPVGKREEGIRGGDRSASTVSCPLHSQSAGVDPIHLPHPDPHRCPVPREQDRV